jgi:hypothetical protein
VPQPSPQWRTWYCTTYNYKFIHWEVIEDVNIELAGSYWWWYGY